MIEQNCSRLLYDLARREGEYKQLLDELQKLTDKCIANIDKMFADKEKELMTV